MSSWWPSLASQLSVASAVLALACKETTQPPPPASSQSAAAPAAPAPVEVPWFQGTWTGAPENASAGASSLTASLTIDGAGTASGSLGGDFVVRGTVDVDTVRLEADGPNGHGVAVLHRQDGTLRGAFYYAAPAAQQGHRVGLKLSRTDFR